VIQVAGYVIDVWRLLEIVVPVGLFIVVLPWAMWTIFRRPLFSSHAAYGMQRWATGLRTRSEEAWGNRPHLLGQLTSLVIGMAGGCVELFIVGLNLIILSRIFDFLGISGLNTFEPDLPFIGKLGDEIGTVSMVAAAIFVAVECGLGIVLFYLWHTPLKLLPSKNQREIDMTRAAKALAGICGFLLLAAVGFECYMNYLQAVTLRLDVTDAAASYAQVGIAAAFIGLIVPLAAEILSGFAWHAAIVPLSESVITVFSAIYYRLAAFCLSWFSYPHQDVRLCSRVGAELNTLARQGRGSYRHLHQVCRRAGQLPTVKQDPSIVQLLTDIEAKLRNV